MKLQLVCLTLNLFIVLGPQFFSYTVEPVAIVVEVASSRLIEFHKKLAKGVLETALGGLGQMLHMYTVMHVQCTPSYSLIH